MVTVDRVFDNGSKHEGKPNGYFGLSTDTKPDKDIINGSTFYCIDTGEVFMYDEENGTWIAQ